jgi:hypothetical protein
MTDSSSSSSSNGASRDGRVRVLADLTVLRPKPRGVIRWGAPEEGIAVQEFTVRSIMDVPTEAMFDVLELAEAAEVIGPERLRDQVARMDRRLKILCPQMTDEILLKMHHAEKLAFLTAALTAPEPEPSEEAPTEAGDPPVPAPAAAPAA